jgi:hypothetical protein
VTTFLQIQYGLDIASLIDITCQRGFMYLLPSSEGSKMIPMIMSSLSMLFFLWYDLPGRTCLLRMNNSNSNIKLRNIILLLLLVNNKKYIHHERWDKNDNPRCSH